MDQDEFFKVKSYALRLLSVRPRSEKEIKQRLNLYLRKKKLTTDIISSVISHLKKLDYIDDKEFAKWWIDQRRTASIRGSKFIKYELKSKGVADDIISSLLKEEEKEEVVKAKLLIIKYFKKLKPLPGINFLRQKLSYYLYSRGFAATDIKKAIDEIIQKR